MTRNDRSLAGWRWVFAALLLAFMIALVHGSSAAKNFSSLHWEDELFFDHVARHVASWQACLTEPLWPGLFRPLTTSCYYYVVEQLTAAPPSVRVQVHHTINLLVYLFNGMLLLAVASQVMRWRYALLAALLFVTRRAHAEVVLNTVEFQVLAALFFALLCLLLFIQARRRKQPWLVGAACVALVGALLSKEPAAITPAILLVYGLLYDRQPAWRWYVAPVGVVFVWVLLFITIFRRFSDHTPTGFAYTWAPEQWLIHYSVYFFSFANMWVREPADWIMPAELVALGSHPVALVGMVALIGLTATLVFCRQRVEKRGFDWLKTFAWGMALFLLGTAPHVLFEDRLFLRYGYFGHAGLAVGVAALLQGVIASGMGAWLARRWELSAQRYPLAGRIDALLHNRSTVQS